MSKFMYFDFRCHSCEITEEHFVKPDVNPLCQKCGTVMQRLISAPRIELGGGKDPDFPTSYDRWEKTNKQKTKQDKKFFADHGVDKMHHHYGS